MIAKNFLGLIFILAPTLTSAASTTYTPYENIPGFTTTGDFYEYITAIYKFGLWAVGIAALFMIVWGGYMYIASAGNSSKAGTAKQVITDAIIGLLLALFSYLLLYLINPDLVKPRKLSEISSGTSTSSSSSSSTSSGGTSAGTCTPVLSGPCSVENLKTTCFGSNAEKASGICNAESGGKETLGSTVDKCQPGNEVISWGLFQFNLTANKMNGLNCPSAFDKMYTGSNKQCTITNSSLYNQCVEAAKNSTYNIEAACTLSKNGTKWSAWGANSKCNY